jgi:uncharacterized protein YebE (UPF0316 family)
MLRLDYLLTNQAGLTVPFFHSIIVYTVVTRLETSRLETEIDKIDPEAFVIMNAVKDVRGGMIKMKPVRRMA